MPLRHFLNALRPIAEGLPIPPVRGNWASQPDFLSKYARSVNVGNNQLKVGSLAHSVPSVFQRPIQFHKAMADESSPLHKAVGGEWRGLMAVFCLADWLGLRLSVEEFAVPAIEASARSSVGSQNVGDLHFRAMLRNQLPTRRVEQHEPDAAGQDQVTIKRISDWERWWVIRCNEKLLGATSPWTLVYTASQYTAPSAIDWISSDSRLIDPIDHYDPKKERQPSAALAILHAWVVKLLADRTTWNFDPNLGAYSTLLITALQAWQNDLHPYSQGFVLDNNKLISRFDGIPGPYNPILWTPTQFPVDGNDSDIYVNTKRGKVLVFYDGMPSTARVNRGTRADRIDIARLPAEGDSFKTRDGVTIHQKFIVASKFFFSQKVVRLNLADGAFRPANITTPLKPGFFKYFGYDHLEGLSITDVGGKCTVKLSLVLANGSKITVPHVYEKDDIAKLDIPDDPAFALWPKHYDTAWKHHFAAYAAPETNLLVTPFYFDDDVEYAEKVEFAQQSDGNSKNENRVRIWHLHDKPAIGFALRLKTKKNGDPIPAVVDLGLVLRDTIEDKGPNILQTSYWRIGVDFGTSSTSVMVDKGSGGNRQEIVELPFPPHMLPLVDPLSTGGAQEEIARNLYPKDDVSSPFRTLLYYAGKQATIFGENGDDGAYTMRFASEVSQDLLNKPIANLKWGVPPGATNGQREVTNTRPEDEADESSWSTPPDAGDALSAYLTALVRYIVWEARCEGVKQVDFGWSYPASLPKPCLSEMQQFWASLEQISWHDEMNVSVVRWMSESEAAVRALTYKVGNIVTNSLTIAVDIGGGSTDIAFWSGGKLLNQVSFKLAGNDMLHEEFMTSDTLMKLFEICTTEPIKLEDAKKMLDRAEIFANAALAEGQARAGDEPQRHPFPVYLFNKKMQSADPWFRIRSLIYLFFTGICYYMGVKARACKGITTPAVDVFFGGRGSSMLTWLSSAHPKLQVAFTQAFLKGLKRPADEGVEMLFPESKDVTVNFRGQALKFDDNYPRLKAEVSTGLLTDPNTRLTSNPPASVSADEKGWTKTTSNLPVKWTDSLTPADLADINAPSGGDKDSTSITDFLVSILHEDEKNSLEGLNVDKKRLQKLKIDGNAVVTLIRKEATKDDLVLQPIFAFELKALMQQYAKME